MSVNLIQTPAHFVTEEQSGKKQYVSFCSRKLFDTE